MIKINLLSEGRRPVVARKAKPTLNLGGQDPNNLLLVAGMILGLLIAGGWWYMTDARAKSVARQVREAEQEFERLRPIINEVNQFKQKQADLENKVAVIKDLKRKQKGPVHIMDRVSRAVPELLWLERMTIRGNRIELRGKAFNTNAVAAFIQNLDEVEEFNEPTAKNIKKGGSGLTLAYSFEIDLGFIPPKDPEEEQETATGP